MARSSPTRRDFLIGGAGRLFAFGSICVALQLTYSMLRTQHEPSSHSVIVVRDRLASMPRQVEAVPSDEVVHCPTEDKDPPAPVCTGDEADCTFDMVAYKDYFVSVVKSETDRMGMTDANEIAPYVVRFFDAASDALIIDIGANVGDTTSRFMSLFTSIECERFHARVNVAQGDIWPCAPVQARILTFEPFPGTYATLQKRAEADNWPENKNYKSFQLALTDSVPESGKTRFYTNGKPGDQQAGLHAFSAGTTDYVEVPASSLDAFLESVPEYRAASIFMLKIDAEGFDAHVLNGSKALLERKAVKFLVAEYNRKWFYPGSRWDLRATTSFLQSLGYQCYFVTPSHLVPLYGRWWDDRYEIRTWSNFFCAQTCDPDALRIVNFYNRNQGIPPGACKCT